MHGADCRQFKPIGVSVGDRPSPGPGEQLGLDATFQLGGGFFREGRG
jgi:hypothetical protein